MTYTKGLGQQLRGHAMFFLFASALALSGCGGGSDGLGGSSSKTLATVPAGSGEVFTVAPMGSTENVQSAQARSFINAAVQSTTTTTVTAADLFAWAERSYPVLFPAGPSTGIFQAYEFRFYPSSGWYLGVASGRVYVLNASQTQGQVVDVGAVTDFVKPVSSGTQTVTAAIDFCNFKDNGSTVTKVASNIAQNFEFAWTCSSTKRQLTSNGIPNHAVGTFPNPNCPNTIAPYTVSFSAPIAPSLNVVTAVEITGYALNGVKLEPSTGGGCANNATSTSTSGSGAACSLSRPNSWRLEAIVPGSPFNFGADFNNAHVQPTGEYHYHGAPTGVFTSLGGQEENSVGNKMQIVGWAVDGYPIYYKYGYTTANDATSPLKNLTGNYKPNSIASTSALRPSASIFPLGTFKEDWAYSVSNGGDLDECNGRTGVTPEFPNGTYYYVATESYPYLQRCIKGKLN